MVSQSPVHLHGASLVNNQPDPVRENNGIRLADPN
jgi:hypothetical protein